RDGADQRCVLVCKRALFWERRKAECDAVICLPERRAHCAVFSAGGDDIPRPVAHAHEPRKWCCCACERCGVGVSHERCCRLGEDDRCRRPCDRDLAKRGREGCLSCATRDIPRYTASGVAVWEFVVDEITGGR